MSELDDFLLEMDTEVLVVVETADIHVVTAGEQGPPGIPGAVGGAAAQITSGIAVQALSGFKVVKGLFGGEGVDYASRTVPTDEWAILGLTLSSVNGGGSVQVQSYGEITNPAWSWVNGPIFLDTNGNLTQTQPTSGFILRVGFARTATKLFINLRTLP